MRGKVKRFNRYGFITGDDGCDYFYRRTDITEKGFKPVYPGDVVEFEPVKTKNGLAARNVRRVDVSALRRRT